MENSSEMTAIKRLGLLSLTCLVIANMIGAGVYTSSGFALDNLGDAKYVLLAWIVAGGIALLGAHCYGRLALWMTASGGEYLFLSRAVSPLLGFMAGWVSMTAGFSGAIAYSALTFKAYLLESGPGLGWADELVPALLILFFGLLHLWGMAVGAAFQNVLVIIKTAALLAFIVGGLVWIGRAPESLAVAIVSGQGAEMKTPMLPSLGAFATSVMWLSFSYAGYNAAVYISGSASNPRTVARSMVLATVLVTALYVALNAVILYSVPPETLVGKPEVLSLAAAAIGGDPLRRGMNGIILVSLATSVSAMLHVAPHVYAQMARDGALPRFLATPEHRPPRAATVLQIALALLLTVFADLRRLLDYQAFVLLLSSAVTAAILLFPRKHLRLAAVVPGGDEFRRDPGDSSSLALGADAWRKTWFSVAAAALFVIASLIIAGLAIRFRVETDPWGLIMAIAILPIGLVAYRFSRH